MAHRPLLDTTGTIMNTMRTIGMIGGMSWESTAEYYRLVNQDVRARLGGLHSAQVLIHSVDFAPIERLQRDGQWNIAGIRLAEAARNLEAGGAHCVVLCTNTMHLVAERCRSCISSIQPASRREHAACEQWALSVLGFRCANPSSATACWNGMA